MSRIILVFAVLAILGVVAAVGAQDTIEAAGNDATVDNETFTPDAGNVTELDDSNKNNTFYDEEVRVWNTTGSTLEEMNASEDYEWLGRNGTVKTLKNGSLENATEAKVTYGYTVSTDREVRMAEMVSYIPMVIGLGLTLLILVLFARVIGG